ncbi:MAG: class C beta-lactamase [Rhodanobacteraceae bacterium]
MSATGAWAAALLAFTIAPAGHGAAASSPAKIKYITNSVIHPLMKKDGIPGMAVGLAVDGRTYLFDFGVSSLATRKPVTRDTLFELGSISKTFTATLASYARINGHLSLNDRVDQFLPSLKGTAFGKVSLLELGTHTPGGLPLQVPDNVRNDTQLMRYFKTWRPSCAPGTCRTYSNISIGTLGLITARSEGKPFTALMEQQLFPTLGLRNTWYDVPAARMGDYAEGYTKKNTPIRMTPGELDSEAYGITASAADMVRFMQANMGLIRLGAKLQRAITTTHTGYFKAGPMTQDLIWEQYPYPVSLKILLEGNAPRMIFDATPVTRITPPQAPRQDAWINKTGSTNGFGAYVAFIPSKRLGIVILANKSYPIADRVTAAYKILTQLAADP